MARGDGVRERMLVAAVLLPVLLDPHRRHVLARVEPRRRAVSWAMIAAPLAGQFWLGSRSFPFVDWAMYTAPVAGDPTIVEYDATLRSGATIPLLFTGLLGTTSAARLMEALRRQVLRYEALPANDPERDRVKLEHEDALRAIARRHSRRRPDDPVARVVVSGRTVSIRTGEKSPPRPLWAIEVG